MSSNDRLVQQNRQSRKNQNDYRLIYAISAAADITLTIAAEMPNPNRELVEALIRQYAERKYSHDNG